MNKTIVVAAWGTFGFIGFVTLSPIGLRPSIGDPELERFAAYALLGALFVLAYPRHYVRTALLIVLAAAGLEAMQQLTPDRHGELADAMEKAIGGFSGCGFGKLGNLILDAWQRRLFIDRASASVFPDEALCDLD